MKEGRQLNALVAELQRQMDTKEDVIARQDVLDMRILPAPAPDGIASPALYIPRHTDEPMPIRPHAHGQFAQRLGIPKIYYDRMMREQPDLLARNVNTWFKADGSAPTRRMIRTLDGNVRAFLSDRYQRIENFEIAQLALAELAEIPDMRVVSCEVTELRLYIKAIFPRVKGEVAVGDVVEAGVMIRNSEVGVCAADVTPFANRLVCKNGMVMPDARFRAYHIGGKAPDGEDAYILADDTRAAEDKAVLLKLRDYIRAATDEKQFASRIEKMQATMGRKITGDPVEAVQVLANAKGLIEGERAAVMRHLIEGGDLSQWGLLNAVTRSAADIASYDRATDLETIGGEMIDMSPSEWRMIAEAA